MASARTLNLLFTLHSWAGVVTGLLMFVVCFSGAVVVFKHEIDLWANPSLRDAPRAAVPALDAALAELKRTHPGATPTLIGLPDAVNPALMVFVQEPGQDAATRTKLALRADTGALIGPVDSQLGQYIRSLHVFLFFGPRWIVGFLGVAMLVLIATGFVIHRKMIAELFTMRWRRSLRVVMSDLHKSAGVWGLVFHVVIAFTGAWLGLAPVFERGFEALSSPVALAPPRGAGKPAAAPAPMASLDRMLADAGAALPGFEPHSIGLQRWGRADAQVSFSGKLSGHLASTARVQLDAVSGRVKSVHDPRGAGFWSLVNALMEPLHFGDFGGLALKWLYFGLGLTPALLSLSGTLIWLDGRRQRQRSAVTAGLAAEHG